VRALAPVTALATAALLGAAGPAPAAEIPNDPDNADADPYQGRPAVPRRLTGAEPPRHPFMAPNGKSNLHNDGYQTDTYFRVPGPLGRRMEVRSTLEVGDCGSVTFDSRGRIVTICVGVEGPRLTVLHPRTLERLAVMTLPPRMPGGVNIFNDFSGGGYFYLDHRDRAVFPTNSRHVFVVAVRDAPSGVTLTKERDYDLTGPVPSGDKIISALPDWSGRIWFISIKGVVGTIDPAGGTVRARSLGEDIANSFAVDDSGAVYVVTERALYRLGAGAGGTPAITWREVYRNSGIAKPGQVHAGSGTTPTVMGKDFVSITDNADPMNVVVYRRAAGVRGSRLACRQPVFRKGASATDQSLIAAGRSMVVENNYGYRGPAATMNGATTSPGLERVDLDGDGRGCRRVWRSSEVAPSVVPKLSLESGLVYTYTKPRRSDDLDTWYFTALDFCTGKTVYRRLAGTGFGHNNNFAPVSLGPDGSAYVGVLGGLVLVRDAVRPSGPPAGSPRGCSPRPRLRLSLRYRRGRDRRGRRCARRGARVRARVLGRDRRLIRRVRFYRGRKLVARDARPPFSKIVDRGRHRGRSHRHRIGARVRLKDGRIVRLSRRFRACAGG
jgi:hypothetical protein